MGTFIKVTLVDVALIFLMWLGHVTWRYATISFWYVFSSRLVVIIFVKAALRSFNKLRYHVIYMIYTNDIYEYNNWVIINHVKYSHETSLFSYLFQPSLVIATFVKVVRYYFLFPTWLHDHKLGHIMVAYHFIVPAKFGLEYWHNTLT